MRPDTGIDTVLATGFDTEPYTIVPVLLRISTSDVDEAVPVANVREIDDTVSTPDVVFNVNESAKNGSDPGNTVDVSGSTPLPSTVPVILRELNVAVIVCGVDTLENVYDVEVAIEDPSTVREAI